MTGPKTGVRSEQKPRSTNALDDFELAIDAGLITRLGRVFPTVLIEESLHREDARFLKTICRRPLQHGQLLTFRVCFRKLYLAGHGRTPGWPVAVDISSSQRVITSVSGVRFSAFGREGPTYPVVPLRNLAG